MRPPSECRLSGCDRGTRRWRAARPAFERRDPDRTCWSLVKRTGGGDVVSFCRRLGYTPAPFSLLGLGTTRSGTVEGSKARLHPSMRSCMIKSMARPTRVLVFGCILVLQACSSSSSSRSGCDDPDIDLCRRIQNSSGPPAGPGGPLEGKSPEEMKNILQHCVELKNRGCL